MITLYDEPDHKVVMYDDLSQGSMVQSNQLAVISKGECMVLDPGGHKVYSQLFSMLAGIVPASGLKHIFFSHQDPDIIAAANGWLMVTDATAYLSELWMRFIPHFGVDDLVVERIRPIPDEGAIIMVGGTPLKVIPAHFLHSSGNFQVYDPRSKTLLSGDLGASLGNDYWKVEDFDAHVKHMEGFHRRYMPSTRAIKMWVTMARTLEIDRIAPQHGAVFPSPEMSRRFIDWLDGLTVGVDLMDEGFRVPG